jgi:hypothetical protein
MFQSRHLIAVQYATNLHMGRHPASFFPQLQPREQAALELSVLPGPTSLLVAGFWGFWVLRVISDNVHGPHKSLSHQCDMQCDCCSVCLLG